jgi:hypothetical protein
MEAHYLEQMQAHLDDGGKLSHQNAVDLLKEVWKLRARNTTKYKDALETIEREVCSSMFYHIQNKFGINDDITSEDVSRLVSIIKQVETQAIRALAIQEFKAA